MADTVVSFVLDHLSQLVAREANLLYGVEDRVQSLQYELQMIKELLSSTKSKKGMEHTVLNQIREVAHLAEDVIDTFVAKVSIYKRRTILGRMLRGFGQARLLRDVAEKIDKIKATLNDIRDNKSKYDAFKETNNQSAAEEEEEEEEGRVQSVQKLRTNVEKDVVGFVHESEVVIKRLLEGGSNRKVVSIVGMGGLGKTTLAWNVTRQLLEKGHFTVMVCLYMSNQFIAKKVLEDVLYVLGVNFEQQCIGKKKGKKSGRDNSSLIEEMKTLARNRLENTRYLVLVDDLWKKQDWDEVQDAFPDNNKGSRILITSRLKEVALAAGDDLPYNLPFLNEKESWELFHRKVFRGEDYPSDLESLGKQMVKSCRGLPLSIIVLAGLLANKEKSDKKWSEVKDNVNWYLTQDETQVKDIVLKLSYDNLPRRLKPCFLYLGIFPEDCEIPVRPLLQKWVAEGFIQDTRSRDPDDVAEDYLYELIDRSLVQIAKVETNGCVETCQVHDLLRDLCISESKEDKVFEVCTYNNILIPTKPRRLSIHSKMDHYISSNDNDHSCVRSLFFFGSFYCVRSRDWKWLLERLKLVRVLEFEINGSNKIPSDIGNFIHLRYLRINMEYVMFVPDSILNLWNLQTIDLGPSRYNRPISFPAKIWKLKHLRHLNAPRAIKLRGSCSGSDEKMWNLQTASTLVLNSQATSLIKKGTFPNLKRLGLIVTSECEDELPKLLQSLQESSYLHKLLIVLRDRDDAGAEGSSDESVKRNNGLKPQELLRNLGQLNCLTILTIGNAFDLLTCALAFPPNVIEVTLSEIDCISDEGMNGLGNHTKLKILRLLGIRASRGDSFVVNCGRGSFPELEVVEMKNLKLRKWMLENGAMWRLQNVVINNCEMLDDLPNELWSLSGLRKVQVKYPSVQMVHMLGNLEINSGCQLVIEN